MVGNPCVGDHHKAKSDKFCGKIRTTVGEHFGIINAANLKRARAAPDWQGRGKIVLEGFQ